MLDLEIILELFAAQGKIAAAIGGTPLTAGDSVCVVFEDFARVTPPGYGSTVYPAACEPIDVLGVLQQRTRRAPAGRPSRSIARRARIDGRPVRIPPSSWAIETRSRRRRMNTLDDERQHTARSRPRTDESRPGTPPRAAAA